MKARGFMRQVGAVARWTGRAVLDTLLPAHCLTCALQVEAPGLLCAACFGRTQFVTEPCCDRCGAPFDAAGQGGVLLTCETCRLRPPAWRQARAALRYDDQTRRIVLPFKYHDRIDIAAALAPHMARAGAALLRRADVLVPVPLHRMRLLSRRYNQAALLAGAVARLSGRPAALDALRRVRSTRQLAHMSQDVRDAEVSGSIAVRQHRLGRIVGAQVVLVDDVLTSGSTANDCARALLAAGAAGVDVLVAARASDMMTA